MTGKGALQWYGGQARMIVQDASDEMMLRLALMVETEAKLNVVENDQIDTGFMLNTIYHVAPASNSYSSTEAGGVKVGKDGTKRTVEKAPQVDIPPEFQAAVAVGAEYAVFQEMRRSFLYLALEQVADKAPGVIVEVGKAVIGNA